MWEGGGREEARERREEELAGRCQRRR